VMIDDEVASQYTSLFVIFLKDKMDPVTNGIHSRSGQNGVVCTFVFFCDRLVDT